MPRVLTLNASGIFSRGTRGFAQGLKIGEETKESRRSCRIPFVDNMQADFIGDNAKLIWPVSLDGKKMQSETYKILAILDKPKD